MPITLTIDLEDPTGRYEPGGSFVAMTQRLLDLCAEFDRRATFFTVGRAIAAAPILLKDIAAQGHEIAFHSHAHVPLTREDPARFRRESKEDKDRLEQLAGKAVTGFRAPQFSLTPKTLWVLDILAELGFYYSSSVMPTTISVFGFPGTPRVPFRWLNGLVEFPLPVGNCGPFAVPYLGGIYLYALPWMLTQFWLRRADPDAALWTYTHPYDFDRTEKFAPYLHGHFWVSSVLWLGRRTAEQKIRKVLSVGGAPPLGERLDTLTSLDTYS